MKRKQIGIYKITSPTGKIYVGQSIDLENRFCTYRALGCKGQKKLYASFIKYGVNSHVFNIIILCDPSELNEKERYYQEAYDCISKNGLNLKLTTTATKTGRHSEETRLKIGLAHKGRVHRKGFTLSEDHKAKIGQSKVGVKRPDVSVRFSEFNKANSGVKNKFFGRKHTEYTKGKLSESRKGKNSGSDNIKSIQVLNIETGIYYDTLAEAGLTINKSAGSLSRWLSGKRKNKTSFIKV